MARSPLPVRLAVAAGLLVLCAAAPATAATPGQGTVSSTARAAAVESHAHEVRQGSTDPECPWCEDTSWGG